ncbi:glycosyltransferase family 2 protein [Tepidiforma thermophila]|uniref:Cellulose synthase/poly-beta-1,6-N-acetylglucosamine synthase-like glycosyltransferase n=1 Tax=Tepidiforma thermophila (strain KCTC 52669 / CGMCC 1.13589 / G233) TaxID=2761530 RepID=A0A2A9HEF0_TEPT2|nr:glycosyltransferase family 2 protein [Tepidiforma thermophila]PFG74178.1 cellulose synthase/poly-beta-1,6-N-acetylglucosamine synthase-like glycosyltransferase [Tepidiforma thermophila]
MFEATPHMVSRPSVSAVPAQSRGEKPVLSVYASSPLWERLGNAIPLALSLLLISFIFWGPFKAPLLFAVLSVAFFVYWLFRSYSVAIACAIGLRRIKHWKATDWRAKYAAHIARSGLPNRWTWPRHLVIIPNYKESEEGLARTIDSLAAQSVASQLVVVLAMEDREPGAREKAARLIARYPGVFADIFATFHPAGLPGETPGKGSNEAWAAREAHIRLIENGGDDIRRYTVTSCDADAVFHPSHFAALNYLFLAAKKPYRTFWQPTIFNSNNIWEIPAPLRIPDGLSGINRTSNLLIPGSVRFPTSCYSLSWQMLHEVDYWDEEVIPEDWHLYLKCAYTLGDDVNVEPLFLPLGNDCVLADGYWKTLKAHYAQSVRHAWGASDIPYAWRAAMHPRSPLSWRRRLVLAGAVTKVHVLWAAQWYIVTLGIFLPSRFAAQFDAPLPGWWVHRYPVPGTGWHPEHLLEPSRWFRIGPEGIFEPTMWLNLPGILVGLCLFPLLVMIVFELRTRGPRPAYVSRWVYLTGLLMWPLMAVITFFFASLPALHAQWKLASGRGLVYRVAEKGSRGLPVRTAVVPEPEPGEAVVVAGGK